MAFVALNVQVQEGATGIVDTLTSCTASGKEKHANDCEDVPCGWHALQLRQSYSRTSGRLLREGCVFGRKGTIVLVREMSKEENDALAKAL